MALIAAPYLILPPEKPAIIRQADMRGIPSWAEMKRREKAVHEGMFPFPFVPPASTAALTLTATDNTSSAADSTTYTFSNRAVGPADTNRIVLVCAGSRCSASSTATLSSSTIGGISATEQAAGNDTDGISNRAVARIVAAVVPTGTTATIVLNFSATMSDCAISVYTFIGASITAASNYTDANEPIAFTTNCNAGGFILAMAQADNDGGAASTYSVTGLSTKDVDINPEGNGRFCTAHQNFASAQSSLAVTLTNSGTRPETAGCAVAYNP